MSNQFQLAVGTLDRPKVWDIELGSEQQHKARRERDGCTITHCYGRNVASGHTHGFPIDFLQ